jgi:hypothetical protein
MKKSAIYLIAIIWVIGLICGTGPLFAQAPDISIELNLDKTHYAYGEPVGATVVVSNQSGQAILVNKGFTSMVYYLEMRVIDPAGKTSVAKRQAFHDEFPDAPPLAWILHEGKPIRVAGCESLPAGWASDPLQSRLEDMREPYDITLPGYYSAQVQLSVMVFEGAPCEADAFAWQGVLTSETVYFYVEASSARVKVNPDQWKLRWKDGDNVPDVEVQLEPEEKGTVEDFDPQSFRMNGIAYNKLKIQPSKIKVYFKAKDAIESLFGELVAGQSYKVLITGRFKSGAPFGGEQQIRIVK